MFKKEALRPLFFIDGSMLRLAALILVLHFDYLKRFLVPPAQCTAAQQPRENALRITENNEG